MEKGGGPLFFPKIRRREKKMKNRKGHPPTRAQKEIMSKSGFDWKQWNVAGKDNISMTIVHKVTGERKVLIC